MLFQTTIAFQNRYIFCYRHEAISRQRCQLCKPTLFLKFAVPKAALNVCARVFTTVQTNVEEKLCVKKKSNCPNFTSYCQFMSLLPWHE